MDEAEFVFFAHRTGDLADPERRFTLSPEDLALINPNTKTAPIFRSRRDAEITAKIYRNVPVLVRRVTPTATPGASSIAGHVQHDERLAPVPHAPRNSSREAPNSTATSGPRATRTWLPLYEAKMAWLFDHRAADVVTSETALVRQGQPDLLLGRPSTKIPIRSVQSSILGSSREDVDAQMVVDDCRAGCLG